MQSYITKMSTSLILPLRVKAYHCSPAGLLSPHMLAHLCQDIASDHADALGFGFDDMKQKGLLWALVTLRIEIARQLRRGMELSVETWPSVVQRLRAGREFRISDAAGDVLVAAGSDWMVLEAQSRRPHDLTGLMPVECLRPERLLGDKLPRLKPEEGGNETGVVSIPYSALDVNGHVNNTEYLRFASDALIRAGHQREVRAFTISFHHEAFLNDKLRLVRAEAADACSVSAFRGDTPVFSVLFEYAPH